MNPEPHLTYPGMLLTTPKGVLNTLGSEEKLLDAVKEILWTVDIFV